MDHDEIVRLYGPWHPHPVEVAVALFADYRGSWWIAGGSIVGVYRRDSRIGLSLTDTFWERDGVTYLRPEIQLLYKAPGLRPQDQRDLDAALPVLDAERRRWLGSALTTAHPGHPWIGALVN